MLLKKLSPAAVEAKDTMWAGRPIRRLTPSPMREFIRGPTTVVATEMQATGDRLEQGARLGRTLQQIEQDRKRDVG